MNAWAWALIDAFAEAGVTDVVSSPGSRSTPFVLAAATNPRLRLHDVLDERAAAFFALGQARATGRPALLVCTSGTAGAHYYPAVIEADAASLPLLVLTADRPPELQGCGAAQTIDQVKLFGDRVRQFFAVPEDPAAARRMAVRALAAAADGPVHLNAYARKPLEPAPARDWPPLPRFFPARFVLDEAAIEELARVCLSARRGLIVAGPAPIAQVTARPAVHALAALTGFPLVAEAASQLRFGLRHVIDAFERIELPEPPDLIVQVGATPTSSALERLRAPRAIIAAHGWPDPGHDATVVVRGEVRAILEALVDRLGRVGPREPTAFAARLSEANARAWPDDDEPRWGEALAARLTAASVPPDGLLAVGNSGPIRFVDAHVPASTTSAPVLSQRGANGIDGLVAGAAGAALAAGRPVTLLLGDLSLLHDLGGLIAARLVREVPLVVVVLHNDGGQLFARLPIATTHPDQLHHFTTPHGLDLRHAAGLAGHRYVEVADAGALEAALAAAQRAAGCTVVCARVG